MAERIGRMDSPSSVSEYSTLGSTSGYTVRRIIPSDSSWRRLSVSAFWLTPSRDFRSSLNLQNLERRFRIVSSFHLLPIICTVVATSHSGSSSRFSICISPKVNQRTHVYTQYPPNTGASEGYIIPPKSETTIHSVVSDFFSASDEICPTPLK